MPRRFCENLILDIGHFDAVDFPVYGHGVYATLGVSLPRDPTRLDLLTGDEWAATVLKARHALAFPEMEDRKHV